MRRRRPRWQDAWKEVAEELGARYKNWSFFDSDGPATLQLVTEHGLITLIRRLVGARLVYHELRAPFWNPRGIRFRLFPTPRWRLLATINRLVGAPKDVVVGDRSIDRMFYIATPSPIPVQGLLSEPAIRHHLVLLPRLEISVHGRSDFPDGLDEIRSPFPDAPGDAARLKRVFELVSEMLRWFAHEGGDYSDQVRLNIRRLEGPGGSVSVRPGTWGEPLRLWEGDKARAEAAVALGESRDVRAYQPLVRALHDPSDAIRRVAARALGNLGDARALERLVPLLGARSPGTYGVAAEAIRSLGAGTLVDAFDEALAGKPNRLKALAGGLRPQVVEALVSSLDRTRRRAFPNVYRALAELAAVEALPVLRSRLKEVVWETPRRECQAAIDALEALLSLPRSAGSGDASTTTLPRPATEATADPTALPRPSGGRPEDGR